MFRSIRNALNSANNSQSIFIKKGVHEEIAQFTLQLSENPMAANTYMQLGEAYAGLRQNANAINYFKTAKNLNPDYRQKATYHIGELYCERRDIEQAGHAYQQLVEMEAPHEATNLLKKIIDTIYQHAVVIGSDEVIKVAVDPVSWPLADTTKSSKISSEHKKKILARMLETTDPVVKQEALWQALINTTFLGKIFYAKRSMRNPNLARGSLHKIATALLAELNKPNVNVSMSEKTRSILTTDTNLLKEIRKHFPKLWNKLMFAQSRTAANDNAISPNNKTGNDLFKKAQSFHDEAIKVGKNLSEYPAKLKNTVEAYSNAIESGVENLSTVYLYRGSCYLQLSKFIASTESESYLIQSINDLSKAIKLKPDLYNAYALRAQAYCQRGDMNLAVDDIKLFERRNDFQKICKDLNNSILRGIYSKINIVDNEYIISTAIKPENWSILSKNFIKFSKNDVVKNNILNSMLIISDTILKRRALWQALLNDSFLGKFFHGNNTVMLDSVARGDLKVIAEALLQEMQKPLPFDFSWNKIDEATAVSIRNNPYLQEDLKNNCIGLYQKLISMQVISESTRKGVSKKSIEPEPIEMTAMVGNSQSNDPEPDDIDYLNRNRIMARF